MRTVHQMAEDIIDREGGYVDNPNDPGGPTNWGVTIHTMRNLGIDVDGDGDVDIEDVKALTKEAAVGIFIKNYFDKPNIDLLPGRIQPAVFDFYVNSGGHATKTLQRLLVNMGESVTVDGAIGPATAKAVDEVMSRGRGAFVVSAYAVARRDFFYRIADRNPKLRVFARRRDGGKGGWIKRAEEFMDVKYHLTTDQHAKRVSKWA